MTMGFAPPPGGMPAGLAVGDSVEFDLRPRPDGRYEIVRIVRSPAPRRAPQPAAGAHAGHAEPTDGSNDVQGAPGHAGHGMGGGQ
jgi:hypothetical protein